MAVFDEAVGALLLTHPFFGTLLMKMEHVPDDTLDPPTAAVNRCQLRYHPELFAKTTLDEAMFVVAHEVMHIAWMHLPRMQYYLEAGIGPDGQPLDTQTYNRAMDYPINHALVVGKVGAVPDPKTTGIHACLDPARYPETMTPEEVYCLLAKDKKKGGGGQGPIDTHDALTGADDPKAITPADILQAATTHKMIIGEYPVGIERLLGSIRRPDVSPWRRLRNFITTNMPGRDATTWRRLQRRYIVRGVGMPGTVSQGAGRVGVVVDTSGSIGEEVLTLFGGHIAAIMSDAFPRDVVVYWVDARVHRRDIVKTPTELRALLRKPVPGGGGTDMPQGVRAAEQDKCNAIVVLTDGYTPFTDSKSPVLWAITSHNISAPSGVTIHI